MVYWIAFVAILIILMASAARGFNLNISPKSFFHFPGERRNLISLGIADITLGTGLIYVLTASAQSGMFMLSIPLGLLVGYILYSRFISYLSIKGNGINKNLFITVRDGLTSKAKVGKMYFDLCITIPIVLIFLFVFSFELFASSALIAAILAPDSMAAAQISIVLILFVSSFAASFFGGMQANVKNDKILAATIIVLVVLIILAAVQQAGVQSNINEASTKHWLHGVSGVEAAVVAAILAFFNGVTTQFYSILNAYTAANFVQVSSLRKVMVRVGYTVSLVLLVLVCVGALSNFGSTGSSLPESVANAFGATFGESMIGQVVKGAIIIGMVSVVFSTVDTLMMSLTYFVYRNILDREITEAESSRSPRLVLSVLFAVGFIPLLGLFATQPNLFYLLLTVATGASVFAPLLVSLGYIAVTTEDEPKGVSVAIALTFGLFLAAAGWAAYSAVVQPSSLTPFISLLVFAVSCATSFILWRRNA